jgi:hypothetical protein
MLYDEKSMTTSLSENKPVFIVFIILLQITKSHDDGVEADVWKDSFFSMGRVYRYIAHSREIQPNVRRI